MPSIRVLMMYLVTGMLCLSLPAQAQAPGPAPGKTASAKAIFAGGCFWCVEEAFDKVPGVISTTSGYIGGQTKNPTYEQVSTGRTGHAEVVQIEYDSAKVSYEKLLDVLWHNIDPTQVNAQFCDHGSPYRSGIFYLGEALAAARRRS